MLIEQTTLNIANIIKQIHEQQNKAINLLHPYLIFQSKQTNELYICDSTFYEMHFCFNKTLNFPICPYFGIFDIDLFINHSDNNDYYQKLLKELSSNSEQVIILCDLKGGSVHTTLAQLTQFNHVIVLSGMNLGMALDIVLRYREGIHKENYDELLENSKAGITLLTKLISENDEDF
jgi:mannose/fructose-specific phosphotransferase system component IIA